MQSTEQEMQRGHDRIQTRRLEDLSFMVGLGGLEMMWLYSFLSTDSVWLTATTSGLGHKPLILDL